MGSINGGSLTAADVWAASTRTLSAFAAHDLFLYPSKDSTYVLGECDSSGTANTFGSWAEVSADVGVGRVVKFVVVALSGSAAAGHIYELELGEGAGSSEAAVEKVDLPGTGYGALFVIPLDRALSDNARLSIRCKDNQAQALGMDVTVGLVG